LGTALDARAQIRLFVKLKLKKCARPGNRAGFFAFGAVGWAELIRAFTPVFAGYAKPIIAADGFRKSSTHPTRHVEIIPQHPTQERTHAV
jgi:hypothetical protein